MTDQIAGSGRMRQLWRFASATVTRLDEDRGFQMAGSLSFTTLLSLVPLVAVAIALVAAFPLFKAWTVAVDDFVVQNLLPSSVGKVVLAHFEQFAQRAARLKTLGALGVAVTALLLMLTIDRSFNQTFRVIRARSLARRLLIYAGVLSLGPLLIGLSVTMTSYLVSVSLGLVKGLPLLGRATLWLLPFLLTCSALALLYRFVPHRRIAWRHALLGALVAGLMFEVVKRGFALYIAQFPTYTVVYGAFAAIPIFLLWLYLSWLIVIYGATLTAMLPGYSIHRTAFATRRAGASLVDSLSILEVLALGAGERRGMTLAGIARSARMTTDACDRLLLDMQRRGWTTQLGLDRWRLACAPEEISVRAVLESQLVEPDLASQIEVRWPALGGLVGRAPHSHDAPEMTLGDLLVAAAPDATVGKIPQ